MTTWMRVLRHRMTGPRRLVALAALLSPAVVGVVLLLGVALGQERIAAMLVLAYLLLLGVAGAALVLRWRRHRSRALDAYAFHGPIAGPAASAIGATPTAHDTASLDRLRIAADLRGASLAAIVSFGAATRAPLARDILAARATSFRADAAGLIAALAADAPGAELRRALGPIDLPALIAFLRVLGGVADDELSRAALRGGSLLAAAHPDAAALRADDRRVLIERLLLADEPETAAVLLEQTGSLAAPEWLLRLDTLHPDRPDARPGAETIWLAAVNALYHRTGLEPLLLAGAGPTRFDRLGTAPVDPVDDGPLISVIMTSHRPGDELETAVRSVIAQSWQRWELIIADDASGPEFDGRLDAVAALDARITVLRAAENGGTYVRRNDALAAATGDLATVHDSDDWAHPRRLELQARHLMARPPLLANLSRSIRATDALRVAQPRGTLLRLTETSLMFRREQVIDRVGWFDAVRKAADTGFRLRIEAVAGESVPVIDLEAPLSVVRFSSTSLSGAELGDGWMHPARIAYSSAHARWIASRRSSGERPYIPRDPYRRPFPAPTALLGLPPVAHDLDLLVAVDVRVNEDASVRDRRLDAAIAEWCSIGLRVGILRSDALVDRPLPHTARGAVQDLINGGAAIEVLHGEEASARIIVALPAECLIGLPPTIRPVRADALLLVEDGQPATPGGRPRSAPRSEIERAAHRLSPDATGRSVRLAAATAAISALREG